MHWLDESSESNNSSNREVIYSGASGYAIVDTGQIVCYDDSDELVTCPVEGEPFYGQDNQHDGHQPSYTDNGDGTVTDNVTGLIWQQSPDTDGDGDIDADAKLSYDEAVAQASTLDLGGYNDWRLPNAKELLSIVDYTRSPDTTGSAAINSLFNSTSIANEAGQTESFDDMGNVLRN